MPRLPSVLIEGVGMSQILVKLRPLNERTVGTIDWYNKNMGNSNSKFGVLNGVGFSLFRTFFQ